ncbi:galactokinase [Eubacterium sp.]
MYNSNLILEKLVSKELDSSLSTLYINTEDVLSVQRKRYENAIKQHNSIFGEKDIEIYSAPGRTEVGGNHTDHQHGEVLAASVNLDAIAIVSDNSDNMIKIVSEGYSPVEIDLDDISYSEDEKETTLSLIKGIINRFIERGFKIGAFNAYITSDVLNGAGLSSSAAFETLIGTILSGLYNDMKISPIDIAIIGQYAENKFFGKPCGLMDQMACSVGGFVHINFENPDKPVVEQVKFDLDKEGYCLCIVDTKGSHADLTEDYAMIPLEMKEVASKMSKEVLGEIDSNDFFKKLPEIAKEVSPRALLRAIHFFNENKRVELETDALLKENFEEFLNLVKASGDSSYKCLQNIYSPKDAKNQPIALALTVSESFLGNNGVCRVHGGGFAGTIQIFVKKDFVSSYKNYIEQIFGEGSCHILNIRGIGGAKVC